MLTSLPINSYSKEKQKQCRDISSPWPYLRRYHPRIFPSVFKLDWSQGGRVISSVMEQKSLSRSSTNSNFSNRCGITVVKTGRCKHSKANICRRRFPPQLCSQVLGLSKHLDETAGSWRFERKPLVRRSVRFEISLRWPSYLLNSVYRAKYSLLFKKIRNLIGKLKFLLSALVKTFQEAHKQESVTAS